MFGFPATPLMWALGQNRQKKYNNITTRQTMSHSLNHLIQANRPTINRTHIDSLCHITYVQRAGELFAPMRTHKCDREVVAKQIFYKILMQHYLSIFINRLDMRIHPYTMHRKTI